MQVYLVDGTFELFRCWFGAPKTRRTDGTEVGATRALLRTLLRLTREAPDAHIAVAFDRVIESFRNDLFHGYKTGAGIEPELLGQFPLAEAATRALGMVTWPMVRYEADDALATAAARWRDEADRVFLCSPDKDLAQCVVGDRVLLRDRIRKRTLNADDVMEKYGVAPTSIPDWLALVGDAADGIPGIPKWGRKSASRLLCHYGTIGQIPEDPTHWKVPVRGAAGLAASLNARRGEAELHSGALACRSLRACGTAARGRLGSALGSQCTEWSHPAGRRRRPRRLDDRPEARSG